MSDGQGSWAVGAALRWNFFAGGADGARPGEAEAARDRARALVARAASQVGLEVRDAPARLDAARERVAVAERAVARAEETLRIVRVRYRGGLTTIVELLTAEAATTEARLRRTEALHDASVHDRDRRCAQRRAVVGQGARPIGLSGPDRAESGEREAGGRLTETETRFTDGENRREHANTPALPSSARNAALFLTFSARC